MPSSQPNSVIFCIAGPKSASHASCEAMYSKTKGAVGTSAASQSQRLPGPASHWPRVLAPPPTWQVSVFTVASLPISKASAMSVLSIIVPWFGSIHCGLPASLVTRFQGRLTMTS